MLRRCAEIIVPFAEVDSVRLFYTDDGTGDPAVLLVHGWSCDSHDWIWQIPTFAERHRVIAADLRGHGRSSVPAGGYEPRALAADLAHLLEILETGPVVAIGHSFGAVIASVLAVERSEMIRALAVVDPAYGIDGKMKDFVMGTLQGLRGQSGYEVAAAAIEPQPVATPRALTTWHRRRLLGTPLHVMAATMAGTFEGENQIGLRPQSDTYLRQRRCPVLAIYAHQSRAAWEATTHIHPYSRCIAWDGSGHWLHQERPAEFNSVVLDWIGGLPAQ
jgi:pimeloyl-ACP methyl ester carboxylesterase